MSTAREQQMRIRIADSHAAYRREVEERRASRERGEEIRSSVAWQENRRWLTSRGIISP